jgi:putative FmdB family regulatory protein
MPIYEYKCRGCGQQFEWLSRRDEKPVCPHCGQEELTKQLSVPAAHTAGATSPPCAAKELGVCGGGGCGGGMCGLNN